MRSLRSSGSVGRPYPGSSRLALSRSWTEIALLLSPAERQIAILACKGLGNNEIAGHTAKSVETVKRQLSTVYQKLGVHSRARLIAELGHRVPR